MSIRLFSAAKVIKMYTKHYLWGTCHIFYPFYSFQNYYAMKPLQKGLTLSLCLFGLFLMHACNPDDTLVVTGVTLNQTELSLTVSQTVTLEVTVTPEELAPTASLPGAVPIRRLHP